ncbi:hypothetical protein [Bacteroides reticulotermitis]|uniref:hypothetical protein n=1 Tax=Bacteroides reticulotermitis TaxID=1133319 RepID=UPI003A8AE88A
MLRYNESKQSALPCIFDEVCTHSKQYIPTISFDSYWQYSKQTEETANQFVKINSYLILNIKTSQTNRISENNPFPVYIYQTYRNIR